MVVPKIRDNNESSNSSSRMKQKSMTIRISSWCCSNYRKRGGATSCHIFIGIAGIWLFGIIVVCLTLLSNNTNKSDKSFIRGANSSANMGDAIRRAGNGMNNDVVANGSQGHQQKGRRKPSKPLCDECLQIVQSAEAIDISYVDVKTDAMGQHPHMGARDEYGNTNDYIHNETALRFNPPKLNYDSLMAGCTNRDNNYRMLHDKVFVDIEYDTSMQTKQQKRPKLFCLIYTIESNHDKVHNIRETWGPKCDGFMIASTKTDPSINAVDIPHEGDEEYGNIWQKVRSMWSYVYDNYYNEYDWFHIGGDDLFLIVENLRYYIESEEIRTAANGGVYLPDDDDDMTASKVQTPLFLGRRFAYLGQKDEIFNSGGSGYTINKAALKTLVVKGFPTYFPHGHTFSEDTMVARTFKKFGILPYETKDETGAERYMPFMPGHHFSYIIPKEYSMKTDWYATYSINIKEGLDHCAARSIAFHYVKGDAMKRFYSMLYGLCPAGTL